MVPEIPPALLWSTASLLLYIAARRAYRRFPSPLLTPVLVTAVVIIAILLLTETSYDTYMEGGRIISYFLGPSVVALGIPLYRNLRELRQAAPAIVMAVALGALAGVLGAMVPAIVMNAPELVVRSLAPKSVTTPIAISLAERIGGDPGLATTFVVVTGIFGAVLGPLILRVARVTHPTAWGLAMGTAAHGIGTSMALEKGHVQGAAAGLGICLCGIATSAVTPVLVRVLLGA
ncbi:MAG: LrgB family protein [Spirochaetaceae bacterium]|nr:MAG: LrgB family protein [Spirochaetaceae bacterium]